MPGVAFTGFEPELIEFLSGLKANNNRTWFEAHRDEYERLLVDPARAFVVAMGECLQGLDPVQGVQLEAVASQGENMGGQTYKKVPHGLHADHPRAQWLRHSGLFASTEQPTPEAVFTDQLPKMFFERFQRVARLQQWLVDLLAA